MNSGSISAVSFVSYLSFLKRHIPRKWPRKRKDNYKLNNPLISWAFIFHQFISYPQKQRWPERRKERWYTVKDSTYIISSLSHSGFVSWWKTGKERWYTVYLVTVFSTTNSFSLLWTSAARLTLKLEKIMNEKKSKRRIQIRDLQKQEIAGLQTSQEPRMLQLNH